MKIASLFSDHMVLQQGTKVPVWGWAEQGDTVTVRFIPAAGSGNKEQSKTAKPGKGGKWTVTLAPLKTCATPARMEVSSAKDAATVIANDVLVGEVWLASGQSNMEWTVKDSLNATDEKAAANWPLIRMFSTPNVIHEKTPDDIPSKWQICAPETVGDFSAVGYFFARELHKREQVPVGIVNSSWGGTRVEAWTSRKALLTDTPGAKEVRTFEAILATKASSGLQKDLAEYQANPKEWMRRNVMPDPGNKGHRRGWARSDFDDSEWQNMELPSAWQRRGVSGNGVVWFRRIVKVPASWAGRDLVLRIGACDKHDTTYFNNVLVGSTGWETESPWMVQRAYKVPGKLVKAGENLVTVRVYSYRNLGGMTGPMEEMRIEPAGNTADKPLPLAGKWKYAVEHDFGPVRGTPGEPNTIPNQNSPYALFNSKIAPLIPYAIRGFIWYQGESNADSCFIYQSHFELIINDWRKHWRMGALPFLFVQLANYFSPFAVKGKSGWPEVREAQLRTLRLPNTGMAVIIDVGDRDDVHPKNKQAVGLRLALAAEAQVYGKKIVYSGPIFRSARTAGSSMRLRFDHIGGGLTAKDGALRGFMIAGKDRQFVAAKAVISDGEVVISADAVKRPVAVRYAWDDNPDCNLYNKEGLPASPFRTDKWNA